MHGNSWPNHAGYSSFKSNSEHVRDQTSYIGSRKMWTVSIYVRPTEKQRLKASWTIICVIHLKTKKKKKDITTLKTVDWSIAETPKHKYGENQTHLMKNKTNKILIRWRHKAAYPESYHLRTRVDVDGGMSPVRRKRVTDWFSLCLRWVP